MTELIKIVTDAMEDVKATDIQVYDVTSITLIADHMIIASGRSARQVKAIADNVAETAKQQGFPPLGMEGEREAEWVLVDIGDLIVHIMQPPTRVYYQLEKLWSTDEDIEART